MDQTKPEDQSLLRHLQERRADPNLDLLIAYLLLVWLKFKSKVGWGLLELTRLAQTMLLERLELWAMLGLRPPDITQVTLWFPFCRNPSCTGNKFAVADGNNYSL